MSSVLDTFLLRLIISILLSSFLVRILVKVFSWILEMLALQDVSVVLKGLLKLKDHSRRQFESQKRGNYK